jgi:hypothetical protein
MYRDFCKMSDIIHMYSGFGVMSIIIHMYVSFAETLQETLPQMWRQLCCRNWLYALPSSSPQRWITLPSHTLERSGNKTIKKRTCFTKDRESNATTVHHTCCSFRMTDIHMHSVNCRNYSVCWYHKSALWLTEKRFKWWQIYSLADIQVPKTTNRLSVQQYAKGSADLQICKKLPKIDHS